MLVLLAAILAGIFAARLFENAAREVVLGEDIEATTADDGADSVNADDEIAAPTSEVSEGLEIEADVPPVEETVAADDAEEVAASADLPGEPADDDWDAEAEWEGELAYRVFSGQGAFDVEEIDIASEPQPATSAEPPRELVRVEAVKPEAEAVADTQELEMVAEPHEAEALDEPSSEDRDPLADLPRQALFDKAKELGVPMKDLIVMDREELIEAIHRAEPAHSR